MTEIIGVVALSVSAVVPVCAARLLLGFIVRMLGRTSSQTESGQTLR